MTNWLTRASCCCLNESSRHPHANLFQGDTTLYLESDDDEQLLLQLSFQQTLRLSSIELGIPGNESCPQTIKLFVNQTNLSFSDAIGKNQDVSSFKFNIHTS